MEETCLENWFSRHVRSKDRLRKLKERAKNPDDPLELDIVRDMLLTGFDSLSMHTMYVDKPMLAPGSCRQSGSSQSRV